MFLVYDNLAKDWWGKFETKKEALDAIYKDFVDTIDARLEDTNDPEEIAELKADKANIRSFSISGTVYGDFEILER